MVKPEEAVIQLADGWNPFRGDLAAADVSREGARIRINGYTKATWIWGAPLFRLTDRIETAKAFSLPLAVAAGLTVLACLLLMTACANSLLVAWGHVPAVVYNSNRLRAHLLDLKANRRPIEVDFGPFRANRVRLAELGCCSPKVLRVVDAVE